MIFIFSYQRLEMLEALVKTIDTDYIILDDGSEFKLQRMHQFKHEGKAGFWRKWQYAFDIAKATNDDLFIFLPSDFQDVQWERINEIHEQLKDQPYLYNIVNDGRQSCWGSGYAKNHDKDSLRVFFTDCGFFCNRKALEAINWKIIPVNAYRFKGNANISSGVGQNLTKQFNRSGVLMLTPKKSLAYHGDHPSVMHPDERKRIPLISR